MSPQVVSSEFDASAGQHSAVIDSDEWIIGSHSQELWSAGVDVETLGLCVAAHVGIQVDQHILGMGTAAGLRGAKVKLPGKQQ